MESHRSASSASPGKGRESQPLSTPLSLGELQSARALLLSQHGLLDRLELALRHHHPLIVHVQGYRHCAETVLALLNYAHALGVTVLLIPAPGEQEGTPKAVGCEAER